MLINLPISEQGTPSELTAAVLYFPSREREGSVNGGSGLSTVKRERPTARPNKHANPIAPIVTTSNNLLTFALKTR